MLLPHLSKFGDPISRACIFLIILPYFCFGEILFHSNFESGQTYTATRLEPGEKTIKLLPSENLSQWPVDGGRGIIESNHPEATDAFEYATRENSVLKGVRGLKKPHAKWVDIRTSSFREWNTGRSRDKGSDPENVFIVSKDPLSGGYSAAFDCRGIAKARLFHALTSLEQDTLHCRFLAKFDHGILRYEAHTIPFFYLNTKTLTTPRVATIKQMAGRGATLTFDAPPQGTVVARDIPKNAPPILPNVPYCVEVSFQKVSPTRLISRLRVNGIKASQLITDHTLYDRGMPGISLGKVRNLDLEGTMQFDEVFVADEPLGMIPFRPIISFRENRLKCSGRRSFGDSVSNVASHWQLSSSNSWLAPLLNTGADSIHICELPHPRVIRLADSLNPLMVFHEPVFIPTGARAGQVCFARMRHCNENGSWSEWSHACRFSVPADGPPEETPAPKIQTIWFTGTDDEIPLCQIKRGGWCNMHVHFSLSPTSHPHSEYFMDINLAADFENDMANFANRGIAFDPRTKYFFGFSQPHTSPYVCEEEGAGAFPRQLVGKGIYCDSSPNSYFHDRQNGVLRIRMRLLEQALCGAWRISAYMKEREGRLSSVYREVFLVADEEKKMERETPPFWIWIAVSIPIFAGIIVLIRRVSRNRTSQSPSGQEGDFPMRSPANDRRVRAAKQYIRENYKRPVSPKDVAQGIHVSPNWLSKLFKRDTGRNVFDYITDLRIHEAKRLLRETEMDDEEIAHNTGFTSTANFRRIFRKYEKKTPFSFRHSA